MSYLDTAAMPEMMLVLALPAHMHDAGAGSEAAQYRHPKIANQRISAPMALRSPQHSFRLKGICAPRQ